MTVYLAIILYIISVVTGILTLFTGKNISTRNFVLGTSIHVLFIVLFIIKITSGSNAITDSFFFKLSFLFAICTGLILLGMSWKSSVHLFLKIYFSLFSVTLLLFLFSPSRLVNFLITASYSDTMGKTFNVAANYFLEEQTSGMNGDASVPHYKLIQKHGMFHKILQRDIIFNGNLDSIRVLGFDEGKETLVRGFSSKNTYVSTELDSVDVLIKLVTEKKNQIERKL